MDFDFGDNIIQEVDVETDSNARCLPIPMIDLPLDVGPRQWVYGTSLVRGMLSVLGGPGGVGKSRYALKVGLSIALGRPLLALKKNEPEHHIYEPRGAVWYISLEDPLEELQRGLIAEIKGGGFDIKLVSDRFYISSGRDTPLVVARSEHGAIKRCSMESVVERIKSRGIVLLIVDPFANSFDGEIGTESGSDAMKVILDQWRIVAHRANCAVWLIHHFRKGGMSGDADSFRGSSVIQNAARIMETVTTMTKDEAESLDVDVNERRQYVRLENAKVNLSAAPSEAQWFKFERVPLGNGNHQYPNGDVVGVLKRWKPRAVVVPMADVDCALDTIDAGREEDEGTEYFSSAPQSDRWAGHVVMEKMGLNRRQATDQIGIWLRDGVLVKDSYSSPSQRKIRERLVVNPDARMRLHQQRAEG